MSKSSHSRFSDMKKKRRRLRRERTVPQVQREAPPNQAPHITEEVLWKSPAGTHTLDLQEMPRSCGDTTPREGTDAQTVLLEHHLPVSEDKPCPCCQLVWKPELCRYCGSPISSGVIRIENRAYHTICVIRFCKGERL